MSAASFNSEFRIPNFGRRPTNPNLKKAVSKLTAFFPVYSNS